MDIAKQETVCNEMMRRTQKQLHQGSHTYEDYGEQDNLHADEQPGYLGAVDELLKVIQFEGKESAYVTPVDSGEGETLYPAPTEDFILSVISLNEGRAYAGRRNRSVEIMICMEGSGRIIDLNAGESRSFSRGTSWIIPAAVRRYSIEGEGTIYKAAVPSK